MCRENIAYKRKNDESCQGSPLLMVRLIPQNAKRAVDLLEQDDACELVGKSKRAEGELVVRQRFHAVGDAGRAADYKGEM